jgi:hypothetical protein
MMQPESSAVVTILPDAWQLPLTLGHGSRGRASDGIAWPLEGES